MRCSVVAPCHNEELTLRELHRRLSDVLPTAADEYTIILVDDGSTDGTLAVMRDLAEGDPHVHYLSFSRNFGHEAASTAGLDRADGDWIVLMDADLQDPPELIPDLVEKWKEGWEEVHATRTRRRGVNPVRKALTWLFYRFIRLVSDIDLPPDTGNFRLLDRKVLDSFRQCRETGRWVCGLVTWVGFKQTRIEYDRPGRFAGKTNYGAVQLVRLALDALSGFSVQPLRIASVLGLLVTAASFIVALIVVIQKLIIGHAPGTPVGYTLTTAGLFFLGGIQMLFLGIIGEYLGRVYRQVQDRPLYIVREERGTAEAETDLPSEDAPPHP